ncbi:uncharacterized protein LOC133198718 [Saccostrea echinata]|uniref:uncharacterized protein LOC133198718 n=1 Tax=Saccostrea echinata TaxID=191078 RepID=UPI002A82A6DD|nr:uncharacterized protein LOC133198718 [Saccostrea echinata]
MLHFIYGQVPIPNRKLGYIYGDVKGLTRINVDAFMGPVCPESKMAFPTLLQLANHYGPNVLTLRMHMFPLPYHRNSFLVAMGAQIINQLSDSQQGVFNWTGNIYNKIDSLSNNATKAMSETMVISMLSDIAVELGVQKSTFIQKMADPMVDEDTRVEWKYTCTRGISGTPMFTVNDVIVQADASWSLEEWKKVIDPLLKNGSTSSNHSVYFTGCKIGTTKCEYLPGKVECCTKGEACIPNVGCRC